MVAENIDKVLEFFFSLPFQRRKQATFLNFFFLSFSLKKLGSSTQHLQMMINKERKVLVFPFTLFVTTFSACIFWFTD